MIAKFVFENINFERGKDPRKSMGLGFDPIKIKYLSKWSSKFQDMAPIDDKRAFRFLEWPFRSYPSTIGVDLEDGSHERFDNILRKNKPLLYKDTLFINDGRGHWIPNKMNESYNFERGQSPRKVMGLGNELLRAMGQAIEDAPMLDKEGISGWYEENPTLMKMLEYKPGIDDPAEDIIGFDEDYYAETYDFDEDEMKRNFIRTGREMGGKKSGELLVTPGKIKGTNIPVMYYHGGMVSGYLSRKEWLENG